MGKLGSIKSSLSETLGNFRNDGTDPRKNDAWRIALFALGHTGSTAATALLGAKWVYYTQNVLQLGVIFATLLGIKTFADAISDPFFAVWFDNTKTQNGKFKKCLLLGGAISILPTFIIFFYPVNPDIPLWVSYIILGSCYLLSIVIGNTILMTAVRAGQSIITQHPKQRPIYSLGQTATDTFILLFVSWVVESDVFGDPQGTTVYRISSVILGVLSMLLILGAIKAISTRDNAKYYTMTKSQNKGSVMEFFSLIKRSKAVRCLVVATASDAIAASMRAQMTIYLFANIMMNQTLNSTFKTISGVILGVPVLLIGMHFAMKKGSAVVYSRISFFQTIVAASGFLACVIFLPPNAEATYTGLTFGILAVLFVFGLYLSSLGISSNLVTAMIGDLTDYEYMESGKFLPGTIGATTNFFNKCVQSLVGLITAGVMVYCGFSGSGEGAKVPREVFINERFYYCVLICVFLLPALGHLATYIAMRKFPLTDEKMKEVSLFMAKERGFIKEDSDLDSADSESVAAEVNAEKVEIPD